MLVMQVRFLWLSTDSLHKVEFDRRCEGGGYGKVIVVY